MDHPESFIDAQSADVTAILAATIRVVQREGGRLHPSVVLWERAGDLRVRVRPDVSGADGQPAFFLPRRLLVPVAGAEWGHSTTELDLRSPPPGLSVAQQELLELWIALYNTTGKIGWIRQNHARLALREAPTVISALRDLRAGFESAADAEIPDVFLHTRVFGLPPLDGAQSTAVGVRGDKQSVLMPLIDLLNHHRRGSPYLLDEHSMHPRIATLPDGDESFANYGGRRDGLDLTLGYAFADPLVPFVRSGPLDVDVPRLGRVQVAGQILSPKSPLDPPRVQLTADGIRFSHVVFQPNHPQRWQTPIRMALQAAATRRGLAADVADDVMRLLVETHIQRLRKLQHSSAAYADRIPAAALFQEVAEGQLRLLSGPTDVVDLREPTRSAPNEEWDLTAPGRSSPARS